MATVYVEQYCYFRDSASGSYRYNSAYDDGLNLEVGGTFTPKLHQPYVPPGYTYDKCVYNGVTYYSGAFTVNSTTSYMAYYFTKEEEPETTVICRKYVSIDNGAPTYAESMEVTSGYTFTPSNYPPSGYSSYTLQSIYTGATVSTADTQVGIGSLMYAPYNDFVLVFYYRHNAQLRAPSGVITSSVTEYNEITLLLTLTAGLEKGSWGAALSLNGVSHDAFGSAESSSRASGSTLTTTFSNLQPNTTYYVLLYNTDGVNSVYSGSIGTVRTKKAPIALFAYTANDSVNITAGKDPSNITAAKWNALGDKISEVSVRVGQGAVSHTTVYQGGRMTAAAFNEANGNIGDLPGASGSPSNQQRGNRLLASLFIALKNALNAAITYANNYYR